MQSQDSKRSAEQSKAEDVHLATVAREISRFDSAKEDISKHKEGSCTWTRPNVNRNHSSRALVARGAPKPTAPVTRTSRSPKSVLITAYMRMTLARADSSFAAAEALVASTIGGGGGGGGGGRGGGGEGGGGG
eukprot:739377-Pleurochrysis_carterae.AAC.2